MIVFDKDGTPIYVALDYEDAVNGLYEFPHVLMLCVDVPRALYVTCALDAYRFFHPEEAESGKPPPLSFPTTKEEATNASTESGKAQS